MIGTRAGIAVGVFLTAVGFVVAQSTAGTERVSPFVGAVFGVISGVPVGRHLGRRLASCSESGFPHWHMIGGSVLAVTLAVLSWSNVIPAPDSFSTASATAFFG